MIDVAIAGPTSPAPKASFVRSGTFSVGMVGACIAPALGASRKMDVKRNVGREVAAGYSPYTNVHSGLTGNASRWIYCPISSHSTTITRQNQVRP